MTGLRVVRNTIRNTLLKSVKSLSEIVNITNPCKSRMCEVHVHLRVLNLRQLRTLLVNYKRFHLRNMQNVLVSLSNS